MYKENGKKILMISEALSAPFDEGIKNVAFSLYTHVKSRSDLIAVTGIENDTNNLTIEKVCLNKLFLSPGLRRLIRTHAPDIILYLPEASVTFNSFIRAKILKMLCGAARVVVLGVQHRGYTTAQEFILSKLLKPDLLLLMGKADEKYFLSRGMRVKVLSPAVDCIKFAPSTKAERKKIRGEYNIPDNKTVVLHVGHIKADRNIECLLELQKIDNIQVVLVGSTSMETDHDLKDALVKSGIKIIDVYVPDIPIIYGMADIYVFPVRGGVTGAIDMPLSVLEAMACNLPVISTRFGALPDFFKEDSALRYFDTREELAGLIKGMDINEEIDNNKKMQPFTWSRFADEVITACDELYE
ncbi:MAG: glycosyltransferase [Nitrospiraceae bacterium]|nr:MAG: glycosyltransferase [Nitrospiraceae bacterium]